MIYFDNAATTKVYESVAKKVYSAMVDNFGNPSSAHIVGFNAEMELLNAKKTVAKFLKCSENEVIFTSGGTESNNLAIIGAAKSYHRYGKKVITTKIEHPSVLNSFKELEEMGFNVVYIDVDEKGFVQEDMLLNEVDENTILVSIMYVNNEFSTIQHINDLAEKVKEKNKNIVFHSDCVQAFGKINICLKNLDLISFSGHKIHAPKGVGGLYIKKGIRLHPLISGGNQQDGIRSGTENIPGIVGFSEAVEIVSKNLEDNYKKVKAVKNELLGIIDELDDVSVNGDENGSSYILSLSFSGVKGEVLLHSLENDEIYVSTGSACSNKGKKHISPIDYLDKSKTSSTVRFSFSSDNTVEEAKKCKESLKKNIEFLRKYKPI